MKDYFVFSAALLDQMEVVTADSEDAAFEQGAVALNATGRLACVEVDEVYKADVRVENHPQVSIERI